MPAIYPATTAELMTLALVFFGITFLIKDSTLLAGPRELASRVEFLEELLRCSFCVGTWAGLTIGAGRLLVLAHSGALPPITGSSAYVCAEVMVFYAMLSAVSSYVMDLVTQALETYIHGGD